MLATIASMCEFNYTSYGAIGFLYQSAKDNIKWARLKPKKLIYSIMRIGDLLAIKEDSDFNKAIARFDKKRDSKNLAAALIRAFGDGKTTKGK